jgi:hypothetical protein
VEAGSEPRGVALGYALTEEEAANVAKPRPDLGALVCSFCGKSREEVPHLFSGRGVKDPSTGAIIASTSATSASSTRVPERHRRCQD